MTKSLSTFRPTLKGVRLSTIFFCSFPCTSTSAGKTPEPEEPDRAIAFNAIFLEPVRR
jgi:hypothetical protein